MSQPFDSAATGPRGPGMWDPMPLVPPVTPPTPPKPEEFVWSKPEELKEPAEQVIAAAGKAKRPARTQTARTASGRPVKKSARKTATRKVTGRPVKKAARKKTSKRPTHR